MAITKMMHMKAAKKGKPSSHLKNAIEYILNPEKVLNAGTPEAYVGTVNCTLSGVYREMMNTKKHYGKLDGRQGYHFVISFKPGEATHEQCFNISKEFIKKYFRDEYEIVYALHKDTDHIHTHIIFNSVNCTTGLKYHYKNGDWGRFIQPIVDSLCMSEGVPTLEYHIDEYVNDDGTIKDQLYSERYNWTEEIKKDIDYAIKISSDWGSFIANMKEQGYTFNYGKYVSVRKPGMQRARRLKENTVGEAYTPEAIIERIHIRCMGGIEPVGIIKNETKHIRNTYVKRQKFIPYKEMDFYERVQVRHMMRIRRAIPQYKATPGNWYVQRKAKELHRTEQKLAIKEMYSIFAVSDIPPVINELNNRVKDIKDKLKYIRIADKEYSDILEAFEKGADLSVFNITRADVEGYISSRDKSVEKLMSELKEIRKHIAVLRSMSDGKEAQLIEYSEREAKQITRYREIKDKLENLKADNNKDIMEITISVQLLNNCELDDEVIQTRVPGTWGKNVRYLRINKEDFAVINNEKTIYTYIDLNSEYELYGSSGEVEEIKKGEDLKIHYDDKEESLNINRNTKDWRL